MFYFNLLIDWLSFEGEGGSFEIGCPGSRGWKNSGHRWTRGVGGLENWTIFVDVIFVSSHKVNLNMTDMEAGYFVKRTLKIIFVMVI